MTYYIVDKKANNLSRTSDFVVTIAITACSSFYVCVLSASAFSVLHLLRLCLLCLGELSAHLFLLWLAPSMSTVPRWIVCLFASSVACSVCFYYTSVSCLLVCVFCGLLRLRLLSVLSASAIPQ